MRSSARTPRPLAYPRAWPRTRRIVCALAFFAVFSSGCSVLVGNIRPVEEKSEAYGVADLSRDDPAWEKLKPNDVHDAEKMGDAATVRATEVTDVAYQSTKTFSVISLDSACRPGHSDRSLQNLTDQLLLGISEVTLREEKLLTVQNCEALETTIRGMVSGEEVQIRTVVVRRRDCDYDLVFVARPKTFARDEPEFSHFVASLKLKE